MRLFRIVSICLFFPTAALADTTVLDADLVISTSPGTADKGIIFQDGTKQTTAGGGGGAGDAVLSATQTFTGANTFSSTITIGPAVYSTTANYNSILEGGCSVVLYSSFTAASSLYISGISSSAYKHILTFIATKATQGSVRLTVNGDTSSNYWTNNRGINTGGTLLTNSGTSSYFDMVACYSSEPPGDGTKMTSNLVILNAPALHNDVFFSGAGRFNYFAGASTHDVGCYGLNGHYVGSSPMTSLTIANSAGTMTGWLTLDACVSTPGH